jgi:predicted nuclease of restriction endonuclease-like (RecB) superfamily
VTGYSVQDLWRMRQFFETYQEKPKLSALVRELSWTRNLIVIGKCKRDEEREFYLRLCIQEHWHYRQFLVQQEMTWHSGFPGPSHVDRLHLFEL